MFNSYNDCGFRHVAHGMIFCRSSRTLWDRYNTKGCVLMQLRCDGQIGFPGGFIEHTEDISNGLNREMEEEIALEVEKYGFTEADFLGVSVSEERQLIHNFFTKEVTEGEFLDIERQSLTADDYGTEVFGIVRVPLFTMCDGWQGLPAFLSNQFITNARQQLLDGLTKNRLLSQNEIDTALKAANTGNTAHTLS